MTRTFIQTSEFVKAWKKLGLSDDDLRQLELEILKNPEVGDIIQGTKGLRKMRFAYKNTGKSGSVRVCYVDFAFYRTVYLITAYPKSKKDNLTMEERNQIRNLIETLESYCGRGR